MGRKFVLLLSLFLSSAFGLLESFATSYPMFVALECLSATSAAAVYPTAFILGIEWAGVNYRVIVSQIIVSAYAIGLALTGVMASYAHEFRHYLRLAYAPGMIAAFIMLFSCESLRWLLVKGKHEEAEKILTRAARINRIELSPKIINAARSFNDKPESNDATPSANNSLKSIFTSRVLLIRFIINSCCWVVGAFATFGISLSAVTLHEDKYMSFILVAISALPASVISIVFLKYLGRPKTIALSFLIAGLSVVGGKLLPAGYAGVAVLSFMFGRCFGGVAFAAVYVQTTEIWPTQQRQSVLALASTVGRVGSIVAPLTPLLVNI